MATISAAQSTGIVTLSGSTNDVVTISSAVGAITIINVSGTSPLSVLAGAVDPGAITAGQAGTFTVLPNSYITLDAKYGQQVVVRVVGSGNQYTVQGAGRASMGNYLDSNQLAGVRADFLTRFAPLLAVPFVSGSYYGAPGGSMTTSAPPEATIRGLPLLVARRAREPAGGLDQRHARAVLDVRDRGPVGDDRLEDPRDLLDLVRRVLLHDAATL